MHRAKAAIVIGRGTSWHHLTPWQVTLTGIESIKLSNTNNVYSALMPAEAWMPTLLPDEPIATVHSIDGQAPFIQVMCAVTPVP